jgi:hypothetical protein
VRREFGNVTLVKETTREMWGWTWLERIVQDVRYGARLMARSPAFTATVVLSLALGIGAVSTVFALINAIELKTLPVSRPGDLVWLKDPSFSFPIFRELRDRGRMFDGLFAWNLRELNVRWRSEPEPVRVLLVTGDFYDTLGVTTIAGRTIAPTDDVVGAPQPVAVLSHAAWVRRFAGDPAVVVDAANLFVVSMEPRPGIDREVFYRDLLERLRGVRGVKAASLSWVPPISDRRGSWTQSIGVDGAPPQDAVAHDAPEAAFFNAVSPGYFDTVGTALVSGRDVRWTDTQAAPRVAIVNESLARAFFPGQSPLGHRITIGLAAARKNLEIVGVVRDAKYQRLQEPTRRIAYLPYEQLPEFIAGNNLVAEVRTARSSAAAIGAVREAVRTMNTTSPIVIETMDARIRDSLVRERLIAFVAALLGGFSLVLCCGSLYGVTSQMVVRRTNEIGIRVALGAPAARVVWMVVRDALQVAVLGTAAGLTLAASNTRVAQRFLFGVSAMDAGSLAAAATVLLATALTAGYLPARRAAHVDPAIALRCE